MLNNTKNMLLLIILIIFSVKSCQIYLESFSDDTEEFVNQTKNTYPDYDKLIENLQKYKSDKNKIEIISTNPPIFTISNFLTRKESDHLIFLYNNKIKLKLKKEKTNVILNNNADGTLFNIINQISKLILVPSDNAKPINIEKINPSLNVKVKSKYDSVLYEANNYQTQTIFTVKGFLNNFQVGEVKIDGIDKTIKPEKGKIIIICNCQDKTKVRHDNSKYTYLPVKSGSEFLFDLHFDETSYDFRKDFEIKKQMLIYKHQEKIAKDRYSKLKKKAHEEYDNILKEGLNEFNDIVNNAFKLQNQYGIDATNEYEKLMMETKDIRDQIKN